MGKAEDELRRAAIGYAEAEEHAAEEPDRSSSMARMKTPTDRLILAATRYARAVRVAADVERTNTRTLAGAPRALKDKIA